MVFAQGNQNAKKMLHDTDLQSFRQKSGKFEWTRGNCNRGGRVKNWNVFAQGTARATSSSKIYSI